MSNINKVKAGVAVAAATMATAATAFAALPASGTFTGKTSQSQKIAFKLKRSAKGGKLSGDIRFKETCAAAGTLPGYVARSFSGVKVSKSGRFNVGVSNAGTVDLGNGYTGDLMLMGLTGKFKSRSKVAGAFDMEMTVTNSQGNTVDHCDTNTVHFSAAKH